MADNPCEPTSGRRRHRVIGGCALPGAAMLLALAGCTLYSPLPLEAPPGVQAPLTVPASTMLPGGLASHPFDPSDGLDVTEVAMLAVVYSPELRVMRAQAKVTRAQAFAAGLLPDPVFGLSRDRPDAGQQGASTAYTRGVSWDFSQLVTYASRQSARRHTDEQVDLALLWGEWQVVARARLLFVHIQHGRELVARLGVESDALQPLRPALAAALVQGTVTFDVATTGLSAVTDMEHQLADARSALLTAEQDLRELLGLAADEPLPLAGDGGVVAPDAAALRAILDESPPRRPDLRALAAGYRAQEARVRAAILGQFPALNFGLTRTRDNSDIASSGFTLSVSLPLFDRNQGAIRVEQATREELRAEYAQRMLTAHADVARLLGAQQILAEREATLAPYVRSLDAKVARAADAYRDGVLEWTVYLGLRQSAAAAATDLITLRDLLAQTRISLATLTGAWPG